MLLNQDFADMTIECGDGRSLPAHQAIICARSSFFHTAMTANMQERETKTISLPEPSAIVSKMLQFLYTGLYGDEQRGAVELERLALFEFHLRIATLADRLLMEGLRIAANAAMRRTILDIELESLDSLIICTKAVYEDRKDIEQDTKAIEVGKEVILKRIVNDRVFERMKQEHPDESLLQNPIFLSDLITKNEHIANELRIPEELPFRLNQPRYRPGPQGAYGAAEGYPYALYNLR